MNALTPEAEIVGRFYGVEAQCNLQQEQPYHRHAAYLFAMGADTREVASAMSVTPQSVRTWLREPWFQDRINQIMRDHGGRDLTQLFQNEAFATLAVMLELRDGLKVPAAVKAGVCRDILDRGFGKPKVFVETTKGVQSDDPVAEVERLKKQREMLSQRDLN